MKKFLIVIEMLFLCFSIFAVEIKSNENRNKKLEKKLTFIELGSVNCIPCKMMEPVMKKIEAKYPKKVTVIFHDVVAKEGRKYALQYGIKLIPTQIFLDKTGKEFFRHQGFFPEKEIVALLDKKLKNDAKEVKK